MKSRSRLTRLRNKMSGGAHMFKRASKVVLGNSTLQKLSIFTKAGSDLLNNLYSFPENRLVTSISSSDNTSSIALRSEYVSQSKLFTAIKPETLKKFFNYEEIEETVPVICGTEVAIILDAMSEFDSQNYNYDLEITEKMYATEKNKYNEVQELEKHFQIKNLVNESLDKMVKKKIDNSKTKDDQKKKLKLYSSDTSNSTNYPIITKESIAMFLLKLENYLKDKRKKKALQDNISEKRVSRGRSVLTKNNANTRLMFIKEKNLKNVIDIQNLTDDEKLAWEKTQDELYNEF